MARGLDVGPASFIVLGAVSLPQPGAQMTRSQLEVSDFNTKHSEITEVSEFTRI